jgi:hypothetical protein
MPQCKWYIAAHARDDAEILLDHGNQPSIAGDLRHATRLSVERFRFLELAALPVTDRDNVLCIGDRCRVIAQFRDGEGGGNAIEARLELTVIQIQAADAAEDHRRLVRLIIGAKKI